ncbi:RES family NAD+ phosphorylase [Mycobacteroides abscessus]|uniref:RES family NAD+ phosphorylase n=1 Tax=Mycobacteroides abscessus TaxID=36809 RepID=UPI00092B5597|nr:RES family NAD+ phosphorylase [Mycobacteroides abscessus]SHQ47301.1 RES domain-containing protein [Mycobacteroides abscessus subsp. abscessus]SKQ86157.1 RES domain-containing protein [Mycobacteroides abscessus subsp. massiliense]SLC48342.1 RES domain-containing protein [Mycobacteroides abscessus subsp. massiliense]
MTVRLPDPPSAARLREIGIRDDEYRTIGPEETWWRVHRTEGHYVLAWNQFREHGPHLRFDPHPPPAGQHAGVGVWYGAHTPTIALAEAFQGDRTIDRRRGQPYLTGLRFTRPLHLIDITTTSAAAWPTRAGGTYALSTGPHSITQRWARRIAEAFPDVDGLHYNSRFAGGPCIVLFSTAQTAMPQHPALSLPLTHPGLAGRIAAAAHRLGYLIC